jgi:hypothetical protein
MKGGSIFCWCMVVGVGVNPLLAQHARASASTGIVGVKGGAALLCGHPE